MRAKKLVRKLARGVRAARETAWALMHRSHPVLVHIIPMRRCNLACAYCNEYDAVSSPVPLDVMLRRIDHLAGLGTAMITISGGEPLMHPELEAMVVHMRRRGIVSSLITNGYLLSPDRIRALNGAGLDYMQISIDNLEPDEIIPRRRICATIASSSGCIRGSPPLTVIMEVPRSASLSSRRAITGRGTGWETVSYSLQ